MYHPTNLSPFFLGVGTKARSVATVGRVTAPFIEPPFMCNSTQSFLLLVVMLSRNPSLLCLYSLKLSATASPNVTWDAFTVLAAVFSSFIPHAASGVSLGILLALLLLLLLLGSQNTLITFESFSDPAANPTIAFFLLVAKLPANTQFSIAVPFPLPRMPPMTSLPFVIPLWTSEL